MDVAKDFKEWDKTFGEDVGLEGDNEAFISLTCETCEEPTIGIFLQALDGSDTIEIPDKGDGIKEIKVPRIKEEKSPEGGISSPFTKLFDIEDDEAQDD